MQMEDVSNVAACFVTKYRDVNCAEIDEMKLHKLMYFAQRESFIVNNQPLFNS